MTRSAAAMHKPRDVFQINEKHGRAGWIGAFVLAEEIKSFGIMGFVAHVKSHDEQQRAYIRVEWQHIDLIGHAPLVPEDLREKQERLEASKTRRDD